MKAEEFYPEKSGSLDGLRHMRLMTLLRDMIDKDGWVKSSEILGVSYRTLVRARESGRLTGRLAHAMERHLLAGGGSEAARQREEMGLLKQKVETLEKLVRETGGRFSGELEGLGAGIEALRKEQAGELRALERRLAKVETGGGAREASIGIPPGGGRPGADPPVEAVLRPGDTGARARRGGGVRRCGATGRRVEGGDEGGGRSEEGGTGHRGPDAVVAAQRST